MSKFQSEAQFTCEECFSGASDPMTAADGAGSPSTNTPGLNGLTKDVGVAIWKDAGCAASTRYPTVPLPRLQCTDSAHAFRNPFTSIMYVCVGTPSRADPDVWMRPAVKSDGTEY